MSDDQLYQKVAEILEQARGQAARTVNTAMVQAYWLIGREIVEVEQAGEQRAGYGEEILRRLSIRLKRVYGKGEGLWRPEPPEHPPVLSNVSEWFFPSGDPEITAFRIERGDVARRTGRG